MNIYKLMNHEGAPVLFAEDQFACALPVGDSDPKHKGLIRVHLKNGQIFWMTGNYHGLDSEMAAHRRTWAKSSNINAEISPCLQGDNLRRLVGDLSL